MKNPLKLKKILNFILVKNPKLVYKIFISFLYLSGPILGYGQENSFFEKTKIQQKINEARHNFVQGNVKSLVFKFKLQ